MEVKPNYPYEPARSNRFILRFPDQLGVKEYAIQKVSPIKFNFATGWENIKITILDIIHEKVTKRLSENIVPRLEGRITLEKLDPTGVCVERIHIDSKFIEIDFGFFEYALEDESNKIVVTISPVRIIVE